jgi:hypothetical protein
MGNNVKSFAVGHSPKALEAADTLISCLTSRGLTYKEAAEALDITKERLGEKAVLLNNDTDRQKIADSIAKDIADGISSAISS